MPLSNIAERMECIAMPTRTGDLQIIVFIGDVFVQRQKITYCGVNAHFQNGLSLGYAGLD